MNCQLIRPGKKPIYLSERLAHRQQLDQETIDRLLALHAELNDLLEEWHATPREQWINGAAEKVEQIEFEMQRLWGFDENANFHTHWLRVPDCSCPKMDNSDIMYYGRGKIISGDCPIHGHQMTLAAQ